MHDTLYFRMKRLERTLTVLLGRMGLFKMLNWIVGKLNKVFPSK